MQRRTIVILLSISAMVLTGVIAADFILSRQATKPNAVQSAGQALIGGPFELTDHTGKRVTEKDYGGRYMLVYFGYTFCPDVCPGELQVISAALDMLGDKVKRIQPIFISVDPDRDTVDVMKEYVSNFHPGFVGLTGSKSEIAAAAKAYRVYYRKGEAGSGKDDYLVDHSSIIYLMGPDGKFVRHFNFGTKPEEISKAIAEIVS